MFQIRLLKRRIGEAEGRGEGAAPLPPSSSAPGEGEVTLGEREVGVRVLTAGETPRFGVVEEGGVADGARAGLSLGVVLLSRGVVLLAEGSRGALSRNEGFWVHTKRNS